MEAKNEFSVSVTVTMYGKDVTFQRKWRPEDWNKWEENGTLAFPRTDVKMLFREIDDAMFGELPPDPKA